MELEESCSLTTNHTTKLQSANSMMLAQKRTFRSKEQNRKPRNVQEVTWEKQYESQSWRNFTLDNVEKILGGNNVTTIVYTMWLYDFMS